MVGTHGLGDFLELFTPRDGTDPAQQRTSYKLNTAGAFKPSGNAGLPPPILTRGDCCIIRNWPRKRAVAPCALSQLHPCTCGCPYAQQRSRCPAWSKRCHVGLCPSAACPDASQTPDSSAWPRFSPCRASRRGLRWELPLSFVPQEPSR